MRAAEGVFEIPRVAIVNLFKIGVGAVLVVLPLANCLDHAELWPIGAPLVLAGLPLIVANAYLLVAWPPVLRASRDGLWFGGGAIIPWLDVGAILDASPPPSPPNESAQTPQATVHHQIQIGFSDRGVVLRLPWWLWFNALLPCRIAISLYLGEHAVTDVLEILESLRLASQRLASRRMATPLMVQPCLEIVADEPTRAPDADELPVARLLRRP